MHRIVYTKGNYIVKKIRKGYYVYNKNRTHQDQHTHIYTLGTSKKLIQLTQLIHKKKVPKSDYLKQSVLRICKDKKLCRDVRHKIAKDKDKDYYINVGGRAR